MSQTVCYEVFPTSKNIEKMRKVLVSRHGFCEKQNKNGPYFYLEINSLDSWQIRTVLEYHGYKYRCFDSRYERTSDYRKHFFASHDGPYHCAYCGKRLRPEQLEVDHLIPVAKAKSNCGVRAWLQILGMKGVNDTRNLVASCKKCNRKKSDSMGFWVLRGSIGRFRLFWTIWRVFVLTLIVLLVYIICSHFPVIQWLLTAFKQ